MTFSPCDIARIKHAVPLLRLLDARGLATRMRRSGRQLVGPCPVHGGDNPHAFLVDPDKNWWHCFTRCAAGGDVIDLVRRLDHASFPDALRTLARLAEMATPLPTPAHADVTPSRLAADTFRPFSRSLPLDHHAPLLSAKGISPHTARTFETGAYHGPGFMQHCIAVRRHDPPGAPIGYAGRRLVEADAAHLGKWELPPRLPRHKILFNFHRIKHSLPSVGAVVVECPWAVMRLHQIGIPAVALLGTVEGLDGFDFARRPQLDPRIVKE
ncbi:MAG: hypothetical protein FJ125_03085, partial [Deltaproteobacteria bacterium]|nr:hypothetical protein [Deltaproteobacteria bacterium]